MLMIIQRVGVIYSYKYFYTELMRDLRLIERFSFEKSYKVMKGVTPYVSRTPDKIVGVY